MPYDLRRRIIMTDTMDFVKFYTGKGWQVFPCQPGHKEPAVKWADEATNDTARALEWWKYNPSANIGIATGARSGLVVVDIDAGHGGEESIKELAAKHSIPETVTAKTGGGGRHLIFKHPGVEIRNSASKLAKGIDIRGDGGYIVAPPSLHPSGNRYQWLSELAPSRHELAPMPEWMITDLLAVTKLEYPQTPIGSPTSAVNQNDGVFSTGTRNATLASLAGTMRRRGMSESAIYTALLEENKAKCNPPLSPNEVAAIAKSVIRYQPGAAPATQNRDRSQIEWAFCKAIYQIPQNFNDFVWMRPDVFQDDALRIFWEKMLNGMTVTQAAGDANILLEIEQIASNPDIIDQYAQQITKYDYLDSIAHSAIELHRMATSGEIDKVGLALESLAEMKLGTVSQSAKGAFDGLMELQNSLMDGRQFIKTKINNFDLEFGGLERRAVSVLAARPSMGKTTLAWQIARNVAASGLRTLFLSLEVSGVSLWRKAAYGLAEINDATMENGKVPAETMDKIQTEIIPELVNAYEGKLFIHDQPPFTPAALGRVVSQIQPDLIVIDHLGFVDEPGEKLVDILGRVMKWAKRTAKKTNSHIMVIHQLNRDVEKRERKEPNLSDLRDSGHIEQDADMVIMLYRPDYYADPIAQKRRYSETHIFTRKNRNGKTGAIALYMDLIQQWFYQKHELQINFERISL